MSDNIVFLHRGVAPRKPPVVRALNPAELDYLRRELAPIRAQHELRRMRERHYRISEESLIDLFAGIVFWFLVGIAPALCVLAVMVLAR